MGRDCESGHFVTFAELRVGLPMVGTEFCCYRRERHTNPIRVKK
jgi:hypothetical protein